MSESIARLAERLLMARGTPGSVFLYPHVGVDGDALGSALALAVALRRIGVRVRLPLDEAVPDRLDFLPALDLIEPYGENLIEEMAADQQLALALDCSDGERAGRRKGLFDLAEQIAVIDHHVSGGDSGDLRWIDPEAAATGEMVFDLITVLEGRLGVSLIDKDIEILVMTAIISDTGGFVFSNTSARTFRTAAALMDGEVDLRRITYQLFDLTSQSRLRLMGRIFTGAVFHCEGRLALAMADQKLLSTCGAGDADLEGVVGHLRNVAGVEVAFLIRETADGKIRVNIRSSDQFNAARFAGLFGGGGHPKAAGLQLDYLGLDDAANLIIGKAGEWL